MNPNKHTLSAAQVKNVKRSKPFWYLIVSRHTRYSVTRQERKIYINRDWLAPKLGGFSI
jgi:hypothetical protein